MCLRNLFGGNNCTWILFVIIVLLLIDDDCGCNAVPMNDHGCGCTGY